MTLTHFTTPLLPTAFAPRTESLNLLHRLGAWAGYRTALCYGDTEMEYAAIRNTAMLYDLCPMTKYRISGVEAEDYLQRLTLRNVSKISVGAVQYTAWCDDTGKVLDDGTLFRLGPQDFMLCCQERHLPWLLDSAQGFDAEVRDHTTALAALSLQGPISATILAAAGLEVSHLKPFRLTNLPFVGGHVMISRTGFTGDLGYELWVTPDLALPLWDTLMEAGAPYGLRPAGSDALDIARIEAGFLIATVDFIPAHHALREDRTRSPFELGLGWMVDFAKGPFTGRRALQAEAATGSKWARVGLDIPGNVAAEGALLYHSKKHEVGQITSAAWSPITKRSIALAEVEARHAKGADVWVEIYAERELKYAKLMLPVTVVERPFYNPARRRATPAGRF
ncbi:MAG: aminomethyltransferase family protein [Cypionkella sp.]